MNPLTLSDFADALRFGDQSNSFGTLNPLSDPLVIERHRSRPLVSQLLASIKRQADDSNASLPVSMPYSYYKQYETTGKRAVYEKHLYSRYTSPIAFNALLALFGDPEEQEHYLEKLSDNLWAACELYTWSLPAHLRGRGLSVWEDPLFDEKDGFRILPRRHDNTRSVDLVATLFAFNLSEILYLLGEKLDPIVVKRVSENIYGRVFAPFLDFNRYWYWEVIKNNWPGVCAGNIGCAAIYMIRDPELLATALYRVFQSISDYINSFDEDGAGEEGLSYWAYGFSSFLNFADLLYRRTAGRIDLFSDERVHAVSSFYDKMILWKNDAASFGDCRVHAKLSLHMIHFLKKTYPDLPLPDREAIAPLGDSGDNRTHFSLLVRCVSWTDDALLNTGGFSESCHILRRSETMLSRKIIDGMPLAFAARGGHNGVSHNHNDVGNFIIDIRGEQMIADIGNGEYNKEYFSERRYEIFNCGSQGHNLPIINGGYQHDTHLSCAKDFSCVASEEFDQAEMDIGAPYKQKELLSLKRSIRFDKTSGVFRLEDRYRFDGKPQSVTERFVTLCKVRLDKEGYAVITSPRGDVLRLSAPEHFVPELETVRVPYPSSTHADVHNMMDATVLNYRADPNYLRPDFSFEITFTPVKGGFTQADSY